MYNQNVINYTSIVRTLRDHKTAMLQQENSEDISVK